MKFNIYIKNFLPLIGILLFAYIIWKTGIEEIGKTILKINFIYLILSISIFIPRFFMSTWKWQMILKMQEINVGFKKLLKINLIGLFYGTITPLWIGDTIRIFYIKGESGETMPKCTSNYVIDQLIELFSLFILSLIGSIIIIKIFPQIFASLFPVFIFILGSVLVLKNKRIGKKFFEILYGIFVPEKLKEKTKKYPEEFYASLPSVRHLIILLIIEIFSYILFFFQIYIVARGMELNIPLITFLFIYPIASLVGQIPITISGFGTREGMLLKLFSIYGIDAGTIVTVSIVGYVVTILIPSLLGLYFSFSMKVNM